MVQAGTTSLSVLQCLQSVDCVRLAGSWVVGAIFIPILLGAAPLGMRTGGLRREWLQRERPVAANLLGLSCCDLVTALQRSLGRMSATAPLLDQR